jgi:hypothetical protein
MNDLMIILRQLNYFKNTEVLSQLYAAHQEGKVNFGFNIEVFLIERKFIASC